MKVGVVVDNEFFQDIRVRREVELLRDNGFNVYVLCFCFNNVKQDLIDGVSIEYLSIPRKLKDVLFFFMNLMPLYDILWSRKVKRFILKHKLSLIHTHDLYMSKPVYRGILSSKENIPLVLDLHENFPVAVKSYNWTKGFFRRLLSMPGIWRIKEKRYLKYPDKVIVLSELYKSKLVEKYSFLSSENIAVFPNVIDFRKFESYNADYEVHKGNNVTFLYFGAVAERRGIFDSIEVVRRVISKGISIRLLIIGPLDKADKGKFMKLINDPGIAGNIEYVPWIDVSELGKYLNKSDVCLSPLVKNDQHESGVANKIYQYMFGKKPIIVSDCEPQMKLVTEANCGLVFSTLDEYEACIVKLANDEDLRIQMGVNGYDVLYKLYDNDIYDNILLDLYENLNITRNNK